MTEGLLTPTPAAVAYAEPGNNAKSSSSLRRENQMNQREASVCWVRPAALAVIAASLFLLADAPLTPPPAHAAGIVVTTLADANPPAADGLCSLREAMTNANTNAGTHSV